MRKVIPSKRMCERFRLTYELKRAQKTVDLLARYYEIRRMKMIVDGRRVGDADRACCDDDNFTACFKKGTIGKCLVLHEFYHHLANLEDWDISERREGIEANGFASRVLERR